MSQRNHSWWDTEIRPSGPWWHIDLSSVWRYRDLVGLLTRRDLIAQYKQSILGPAWLVLQPLLVTITYTVMFGLVARMATSDLPPLLFYLSGIVPWTYFAAVLNRTSNSLYGNAHLFSKVYFPRLVMPVSVTLTSLFTFLVQLVLVFAIILIYAHYTGFVWAPGWGILALPVVIAIMTLIGLAFGILIAAITTKYRDLAFLVTFGTQLLMFCSPVIVPLEMARSIPALYTVLRINPMSPAIEAMRALLFGRPIPWADLGTSTAIAAVVLAVALVVFNKVERSFTDVA